MPIELKRSFVATESGWTLISETGTGGEALNYTGLTSNLNKGAIAGGVTPPSGMPSAYIFKGIIYSGGALQYTETGLDPAKTFDLYLLVWYRTGFYSGFSANVLINTVNKGSFTYVADFSGAGANDGQASIYKIANLQSDGSGNLLIRVAPTSGYTALSGYILQEIV